jgi:hypothetical protein
MSSFIGFEPSKPSKAFSKLMFVSDGTRYVRYELLISSVAALVVFMDSWRGVGSPGVARGLGTVMRIDMMYYNHKVKKLNVFINLVRV